MALVKNSLRLRQFTSKTSVSSSQTYRLGISNDLVLSASMGWSSKEPQTHLEHFQTLKNKQHFCSQKPQIPGQQQQKKFNPYSLDPQNIGHNQCFTSTVMHALSLQILMEGMRQKLKLNRRLRFLDLGCGFGYSTLAFAMIADQLVQPGDTVHIIGADIYEDFIEKCIINNQTYKSDIQNSKDVRVDFQKFDFLSEEEQKSANQIQNGMFDIVNFGFETSMQILQQKKQNQEICLFLQFLSLQLQQVLNEVMKTSFSLRVDKKNDMNKRLDNDYFNTYMKHQKIETFKNELQSLESNFLSLKEKHIGGKELKLVELLKVPEIAQVLKEIGDRKKKIQKLEFALNDQLKSQNEETQ
eukprot:403332036